MKKFIKMLMCFCLCLVSFAFTACGTSVKLETPEANDKVYSNGGLVVRKGDFVYFANGYSSVQAIVDGEEKYKKSYSHSNLTMAKLNEKGEFERLDNGSVKEVNKVSSRLAGFEASDIRVYGNHIYFTTIKTEKNKNGDREIERLEVRRMKLGGGSTEKVFRSSSKYADSEGKQIVNFHYFEKDGNVYLLVNDNGVVKRVKCTNGSIGSTEKVSEDVLSLVVPEEDETCLDGIFFLTKEDGISAINRYDVEQDKVITKKTLSKGDSVDKLFASKFDTLYFYATFEEEGASYLYYLDYDKFEEVSISYNTCYNNRILHGESTKIYLLESMADGILAIDSNEVKIIDHFNPSTQLKIKENLPADANIVLVDNGFVYFLSGSTIKAWNYSKDEAYTVITESTNTICDYGFDLVNNYLYYFATCGENDYLFRVNAKVENNESSELVGSYQKSDDPTIEETEQQD